MQWRTHLSYHISHILLMIEIRNNICNTESRFTDLFLNYRQGLEFLSSNKEFIYRIYYELMIKAFEY